MLQKMKDMKYILVTGGVISGIGKGVVASSLGVLLKHCGVEVTSIKIDPYINIGMLYLTFLLSYLYKSGPKLYILYFQMLVHFLRMSMERCMCSMMEGRWTWIWATTRDS